MSVRVAASAGFCFGVDRAVGLVEKTVREGKRAVTLGPIIHNHHVVQHFAALGVREIASPEEVPGGIQYGPRYRGDAADWLETAFHPAQKRAETYR